MEKRKLNLQFFGADEEGGFSPEDLPDDESGQIFEDETETDEEEEPGASDEGDDDFSLDDESNDDEESTDETEDDEDFSLDEEEFEAAKQKDPSLKRFKKSGDFIKAFQELERKLDEVTAAAQKDPKPKPEQTEQKPNSVTEPPIVDVGAIIGKKYTNEQLAERLIEGEDLVTLFADMIAMSFNELQKPVVSQVQQMLAPALEAGEAHRISKEQQAEAKRYTDTANELSRKFKDFETVKPYMIKALQKNPDLVKRPEDYENLYYRTKDRLKEIGRYDTVRAKSNATKQISKVTHSGSRPAKNGRNAEEAYLDDLFPTE